MDSREQTLQPLIGNGEKNLLVDDFASGLDNSLLNNREASSLSNQSNYLELASPNASHDVDNEIQELVFIDSAVTDSQTLIDNISGTTEVVILNDETDGVLQISQSLSQYQNIDAIHLVSHGDAGRLFLGNTQLNADNLEGYTEILANWDDSLTEEADILLYGCDIAANEEGLAFLNDLSELTRADVLASEDTTGSSILGGDWNLEIALGSVETDIVFDSDVSNLYQHTFFDSSFDIDLSLSYGDIFIESGVFEDNFDDFEFSFTDGTDLDFSFTDDPDIEFSFTESDIDFDSVSFETIDSDENLTYEIYDTEGEVIVVETDFTAVDYSFVTDPDSFDFNDDFYLESNTDVTNAGVEPFLHYMQSGWKEGRDPSRYFDTSYYLETHPDVRIAGVNPLEHYNTSGWKELRDPSPFFDTSHYLESNPDVLAANVNPLQHFQGNGWKEGRNPNQFFNTNYYLDQNPDVKLSGMNPLDHYIISGATEGRLPSVLFDGEYYLEANPDVARAGLNPLQHFLGSGFKEGRSPNEAIADALGSEAVLVAPFESDISEDFERFQDIAFSFFYDPDINTDNVKLDTIPLPVITGVGDVGFTWVSAETIKEADSLSKLIDSNSNKVFFLSDNDPISSELNLNFRFPGEDNYEIAGPFQVIEDVLEPVSDKAEEVIDWTRNNAHNIRKNAGKLLDGYVTQQILNQTGGELIIGVTDPELNLDIQEHTDSSIWFKVGRALADLQGITQGTAEAIGGRGLQAAGVAGSGVSGGVSLLGVPVGELAFAHGVTVAASSVHDLKQIFTETGEYKPFFEINHGDTGKNARELRSNMSNAGTVFNRGDEAHHIIPSTDSRTPEARELRELLEDDFGIDINDSVNGAKLTNNQHHGNGLHSKRNYAELNRRLSQASNQQEARDILRQIGNEMENGTYTFPSN